MSMSLHVFKGYSSSAIHPMLGKEEHSLLYQRLNTHFPVSESLHRLHSTRHKPSDPWYFLFIHYMELYNETPTRVDLWLVLVIDENYLAKTDMFSSWFKNRLIQKSISN